MKQEHKWVIEITLIAFLISLIFTTASETTLSQTTSLFGIVVVLFFIIVGVFFDMIGTAVISADPKPFNSMAAKKIRGGSIAINVIKNSAKVSSFCNDVVGDICGIISGSGGIYLSIAISHKYNLHPFTITLLITAIIASLTIGGKAVGKVLATKKSTIILLKFSQFLSLWSKEY